MSGIFNVLADVDAFVGTRGLNAHRKRVFTESTLRASIWRKDVVNQCLESALKTDSGGKSLAAWGNRTRVSTGPGFSIRRFTHWAVPPLLLSVFYSLNVLEPRIISNTPTRRKTLRGKKKKKKKEKKKKKKSNKKEKKKRKRKKSLKLRFYSFLSPWYNRHGWPELKYQATSLLVYWFCV